MRLCRAKRKGLLLETAAGLSTLLLSLEHTLYPHDQVRAMAGRGGQAAAAGGGYGPGRAAAGGGATLNPVD